MLIFTAVRTEAKAVADAFGLRVGRGAGMASFWAGTVPVELHVVGIGARRLPSGLARQTVRGIIMAGVAGALDPRLTIGEVIVDGLPEQCALDSPARRGKIHTAESLVATAADKAKLFAETGALAVEMEGAKARALARSLGVPFLAIRAVSDRADEGIDPAMLGLVDELGRARPLAIAKMLIRRPSSVKDLARLGSNARLAARNVARVIAELLASSGRKLECWSGPAGAIGNATG